MGIHVKVVDRSDWVGKLASASRLDEISISDCLTMVVKVVAYLEGHAPYSRHCTPSTPRAATLSRLDIVDHGSEDRIQIGADKVSAGNFDLQFRAVLMPLALHFDRNGFAHLQNCLAGTNIPLLEKFADTWGVPIVAGKGYDVELGVTQMNTDKYVRVFPSARNGNRRAPDTFRWRP